MPTHLLKHKRALVIDLDGTVFIDAHPIEGCIEFLNRHADRFTFYFLTNNTSKGSSDYGALLKKMGLKKCIAGQVITPVASCARYCIEKKTGPVYCVGTSRMQRELAACGVRVTGQASGARALVLGYDTELTYKKLASAALLLQNKKVRYLATHHDLVCPGKNGPVPDIGSFIALLETATGRAPDKIFGKPDPSLLAPVLARFKKHEIAVIGDRLYTDKKLADKAGVDFILVLSGETMQTGNKVQGKKPLAIVKSLGKIIV